MLKLFTSDIIIVISALYLIWLWLSWYCHDGSDVDYDHHSDDDDDDGDKYPFLPSGSLSDLTAGAPTTKGTTQPPSHQTSPSNQTIKTPNHQTIKTSKYQKVKPSKHHHHTACQWHPHSWADQLRVTLKDLWRRPALVIPLNNLFLWQSLTSLAGQIRGQVSAGGGLKRFHDSFNFVFYIVWGWRYTQG